MLGPLPCCWAYLAGFRGRNKYYINRTTHLVCFCVQAGWGRVFAMHAISPAIPVRQLVPGCCWVHFMAVLLVKVLGGVKMYLCKVYYVNKCSFHHLFGYWRVGKGGCGHRLWMTLQTSFLWNFQSTISSSCNSRPHRHPKQLSSLSYLR